MLIIPGTCWSLVQAGKRAYGHCTSSSRWSHCNRTFQVCMTHPRQGTKSTSIGFVRRVQRVYPGASQGVVSTLRCDFFEYQQVNEHVGIRERGGGVKFL